jgi:DNA polymerase I-like protein with 3'-5' exonuclease and polymerase domains
MIRSLFLPEDGEQWAAIDYSQQEPRILVHYAHAFGEMQNRVLGGVPEFVQSYNDDPRTDFHTMVADMAGIPRKQAKTVNLGIMYGMGVGKLAIELDLPEEQARNLINQYHDRVPFVKELMKGVQNHLSQRGSLGHVRSLLGRKCRFDLWEPKQFGMFKALPFEQAVLEHGKHTPLVRAYTYKALNRLIQASAADMTKKAMVDLYNEGYLPMLQIHDELAMSVKSREEAEKVALIMQNAVPLEVPSLCDVELGPSWGEAV